jgi:hypothetical protein
MTEAFLSVEGHPMLSNFHAKASEIQFSQRSSWLWLHSGSSPKKLAVQNTLIEKSRKTAIAL